MTGRSMSDELMQERYGWDKEPWVCSLCGSRFATLVGRGDGCQPVLRPRPSCIPSPDPKPFEYYGTDDEAFTGHPEDYSSEGVPVRSDHFGLHFEFHPGRWGEFTPDPKFVRSEVNPILAAFRDALPDWYRANANTFRAVSMHWALDYWLSEEGQDHWLSATPSQVAFARLVLTRLRNVVEASK